MDGNTAYALAKKYTDTHSGAPSDLQVENAIDSLVQKYPNKFGYDDTEIRGLISSQSEEIAKLLPKFTSADNGKILGVVNGRLAWVVGGSSSSTLIGEYVSRVLLDNGYWRELSGTTGVAHIQGLCIDDDGMLYAGVIDDSDTNNTTVYKYNPQTATLVEKVYDYSLGHCNSMTYCEADGYIHCIQLDDLGTVHRITKTLEYVDSYVVSLPSYADYVGVGAVTYNDLRKEFAYLIRGDKKGYIICDENKNFKKVLWVDKFNATYGGLESDENFLYQVIYNTSKIIVYTWDGVYVDEIDISDTNKEIEECAFLGDNMYMGAYLNAQKANIQKWSITEHKEYFA